MPNNKLPDRWLDYSKVGDVVSGSRFLPIKVPLKSSLTHCLPKESQFDTRDVLQLTEKKGIRVGLVIDLTNTKRYYCSDDFTGNQIGYCKIFTPGKVLPSRQILKQFYDIVTQFENDNRCNNDVIVVHCTHGLNRTGYMICKFFIEKKNMSPDQAIFEFNRARGHDIEREVYLEDLRSSLKGSERTYRQNDKSSFRHNGRAGGSKSFGATFPKPLFPSRWSNSDYSDASFPKPSFPSRWSNSDYSGASFPKPSFPSRWSNSGWHSESGNKKYATSQFQSDNSSRSWNGYSGRDDQTHSKGNQYGGSYGDSQYSWGYGRPKRSQPNKSSHSGYSSQSYSFDQSSKPRKHRGSRKAKKLDGFQEI